MKYTFEVTETERAALVDALTKGASRHESYAKFYPKRRATEKHEDAARLMHRLRRRFDFLRETA